jgi:hypothetical protein
LSHGSTLLEDTTQSGVRIEFFCFLYFNMVVSQQKQDAQLGHAGIDQGVQKLEPKPCGSSSFAGRSASRWRSRIILAVIVSRAILGLLQRRGPRSPPKPLRQRDVETMIGQVAEGRSGKSVGGQTGDFAVGLT